MPAPGVEGGAGTAMRIAVVAGGLSGGTPAAPADAPRRVLRSLPTRQPHVLQPRTARAVRTARPAASGRDEHRAAGNPVAGTSRACRTVPPVAGLMAPVVRRRRRVGRVFKAPDSVTVKRGEQLSLELSKRKIPPPGAYAPPSPRYAGEGFDGVILTKNALF